MDILNAIIGLMGTAVIGMIAWAFQIGNRVSVVEADHKSLVTLINTRFEALEQRFDRIESLLDRRR